MALRLTMGFSDNPRAQPLKDGIVKPQGIELDCVTLDPGNLFQRNLTYDELDVSGKDFEEQAGPWGRPSSARSGAPWSRGCSAGRCGARTSATGRR